MQAIEENSPRGPGVGRPSRRGGSEITPRDLAILRWLGRHGLATPDQVARHFFRRENGTVGRWAAYRRLRRLDERGLLRRDRTFWKEPQVLRLTPEGARLAALGLAPAQLVLAEVRHTLALVDLTERLLDEHPGAVLRTERELWVERWRERRDGTRVRGQGRTPDGALGLPVGETVAIELDLTPKHSREIQRIIAAYNAEPYKRVWWFVRPGATSARIRGIVHAARADDFIEIREWSG